MKTLSFMLGMSILAIIGKCNAEGSANPDPRPMVQLETFGCRGFCPSYKLLFYSNGLVAYEGIRHVVKMGKDSIRLTAKELKDLQAELKKQHLWQYPNRYETHIADAPSSGITVFDLDKSHAITGAGERPQAIHDVETYLKNLAEAHGLRVKKGVDPYAAPDNQKEITVKFNPEVNPGNFMMQFSDIRLRIVRRVSAENIWQIGYNPDQITEEQLSDMLIKMEGVLEAGAKKKK